MAARIIATTLAAIKMKKNLIILLTILLSSCITKKKDNAVNDIKRDLQEIEIHLENGNISQDLGEKLRAFISDGGKLDDSDWLYFIMADLSKFKDQSISEIVRFRNEQVLVKTTEVYKTLRRAGFFKGIKPKIHEEKAIKQKELVELTVDYALQDQNKILLKDLEADVGKGNEAYKDFLLQLAHLSDGVFTPRNIKEIWESEEGPIHFSYEFNNTLYKHEPKYLNDWIDGSFLESLNRDIDKLNCGFYTFRADILEVVIVFLHDDEVSILEKELNWQLVKI